VTGKALKELKDCERALKEEGRHCAKRLRLRRHFRYKDADPT
jgi:hypothetical protein